MSNDAAGAKPSALTWEILDIATAQAGWRAVFIDLDVDDEDQDEEDVSSDDYYELPVAAWALCGVRGAPDQGRFTFPMIRNADTLAHLDVLYPGTFNGFAGVVGPGEHPLDHKEHLLDIRDQALAREDAAWKQEETRREAVLAGNLEPQPGDEEWMSALAGNPVAVDEVGDDEDEGDEGAEAPEGDAPS